MSGRQPKTGILPSRKKGIFSKLFPYEEYSEQK
jgi:hypothetical protein